MGPTTIAVSQWGFADNEGFDTTMGPVTTLGLGHGSGDIKLDDTAANGHAIEIFKTGEDMSGNNGDPGRDKQVKTNKIYVGGLPDNIRQDDLRSCFGKIGDIVNIELKAGFGFVEFDTKEAAEESVSKYHDGYFMGNKIRVELSHSRGRIKRSDDPGACFRCGESGHWARECPRFSTGSHSSRVGPYEPSQRDRTHSRDHPSTNRDEFARYPPPRDGHVHNYPPRQPLERDHRRVLAPRDSRDRPSMQLPPRRDHDDYRMRRAPKPPSAARYDQSGYQAPDRDYPPRGQPPVPPPQSNSYDRYNRRPPPMGDERLPPFSLNTGTARTPPTVPPPRRDDYDRPPLSYGPPQQGRRRPTTPSHHSNNPDGSRYRRRSLSPPPRYDSIFGEPAHTDGGRSSGPLRDGTRVRDYYHNDRAGDFGNRRP